MGITFWMVPYLTGRKFTKTMEKLGFIQIGLWAVGMLLMSTAQHVLGLLGAPRRTAYTGYNDHPAALEWFDGILSSHVTMAIGGSILFLSAMLLLYIVIMSAFLSPKAVEADEFVEFPLAESDKAATPKFLENWLLWIGIAFALIIIAYAIPIFQMIQHAPPGSKGFITW